MMKRLEPYPADCPASLLMGGVFSFQLAYALTSPWRELPRCG